MTDDLKTGYYLLFVDGGIRGKPGQKKGAIGAVLREPRCGDLVEPPLAKEVGSVGSPLEAEYHALVLGLKFAKKNGIRNLAVFSDSRTLVNQMMGGWNKNERVTELHAKADEIFRTFKGRQLSWIPREMNGDADKLVNEAFEARP